MFDTIVTNAQIYTMECEGECFGAMGITDGKIASLFAMTPDHPQKLAKRIIDAHGQAVLPGLTDSHMHFMLTSLIHEVGSPISEVVNGSLQPTSFKGVKQKVQAFAATKSPKQALIFNNIIIPSLSEGRLPCKDEIDEWLPERIVIFLSIDGHASSLSTLALQKMGIDPLNHDGILTEDMPECDVTKLFELATEDISLKQSLNGIKSTLNEAIKYGLVDLHCLEGTTNGISEDAGLKVMLKLGGKFPLHIHLYPQVRNVDLLDPYLNQMSSPRVGGCFIWQMDGSVGARTAAFYDPYIGEPDNRGTILYPHEELSNDVQRAYHKGYQITTHAIGTRAIDRVLDVYETILQQNSDLDNKQRLRIDHFEFPSLAAIERAVSKLHVIINPQPGFNWINSHFSSMHMYEKYLNPEIVALQTPLRSIIKKGGIICGSSDSPIQSLNPFLQIHGMVHFPIESERISVYEAFRAYTYNGAYATHSEQTRGTLSVGKWADFIILTKNPFTIASDDLLNLEVKATYINGEHIKPVNGGPWKFLLRLLFSKTKKI